MATRRFIDSGSVKEPWRPVVGLEGFYEVSSAGHVRRVGRQHGASPGRLLKHSPGRCGYPTVCLGRDGVKRVYLVHRLVAAAFIGPCPPGKEVNHIDRDRSNPVASNLEYVTRSENMRHAYRTGVVSIKGEGKVQAKLTDALVREIRTSPEGDREIGRRLGIHHKTVGNIRHRKKWKHVA